MRGFTRAGVVSAACAALLFCATTTRASGPVAFAGNGACGSCCLQKCPAPFKWFSEGGPRICFKCACPRPVCDPCKLEHAGYYATCWSPWPYPPDWSHCPTPPSGAVLPPPAYPPYAPRRPAATPGIGVTEPTRELPAPAVAPPPIDSSTPVCVFCSSKKAIHCRAMDQPSTSTASYIAANSKVRSAGKTAAAKGLFPRNISTSAARPSGTAPH